MRPTPADVGSFLEADETVRWSGHPPDGVIFHGYDIFLIPFSLLWGGFALLWNLVVWATVLGAVLEKGFSGASPAIYIAPIFGLPFLIAGYYIVIGRFQSDATARSKTLYVLTNRRAVIAKGKRVREIRGYELNAGAHITVHERRNGSGSIVFGQPDPWFVRSGGGYSYRIPEFRFERIARVREVVQLIDEIQRTSSS